MLSLGCVPLQKPQLKSEVKISVFVPRDFLFLFHFGPSSLSLTSVTIIDNLDLDVFTFWYEIFWKLYFHILLWSQLSGHSVRKTF